MKTLPLLLVNGVIRENTQIITARHYFIDIATTDIIKNLTDGYQKDK